MENYRWDGWALTACISDCIWPAVLGGVGAALQLLKTPDVGERQLTGAGTYSPYRPSTAARPVNLLGRSRLSTANGVNGQWV